MHVGFHRCRDALVDALDSGLLLDDVAKLGIQDSKRVLIIGVLLDKLLQVCEGAYHRDLHRTLHCELVVENYSLTKNP